MAGMLSLLEVWMMVAESKKERQSEREAETQFHFEQ